MKGHLASAHKRCSAKFADEWPLARVDPPVLVHVPLLRKCLPAEVTRKRLVAGVDAKVSVEISSLRKPEQNPIQCHKIPIHNCSIQYLGMVNGVSRIRANMVAWF